MAATPIRINKWVQTRVQFLTGLGTVGEIDVDFQTGSIHNWTQPELRALNIALWSVIGNQIRGMCPTSIFFTQLVSTDLGPTGGAQDVYDLGLLAGTATGDVEPYNVTLVFTKQTGFIGRSHRGRSYMPPASDLSFSGGYAIPGYVLATQQLGNLLVAFSNPTGVAVDYVVASRKLLNLFPITSIRTDNIPDSQRRRLPGRGA